MLVTLPPSLQCGNQLVHREEALQSEKNMLLKQIAFRDEFIEVRVCLQHMCIHVCMYMYTHTGLATRWSRVRTPSEAAKFFSLSAFGLCLTSLVLICIYMCKIDHVHVHTSAAVPPSSFPLVRVLPRKHLVVIG